MCVCESESESECVCVCVCVCVIGYILEDGFPHVQGNYKSDSVNQRLRGIQVTSIKTIRYCAVDTYLSIYHTITAS